MRRLVTLLLLAAFAPTTFPSSVVAESGADDVFRLEQQPVIRVGLMTDARSVAIAGEDESLIASSPGEEVRTIESKQLIFESRNYRPPVIDFYRVEVRGFPSEELARSASSRINEATGFVPVAIPDEETSSWTVALPEAFERLQDASAFQVVLNSLGYTDVNFRAEKKVRPHPDAMLLTEQVRDPKSSRTEIRSLTGTTSARRRSVTVPDVAKIDSSIREIVAAADEPEDTFFSLRPVTVESPQEGRSLRINGKPYRGKAEVFVNSKGSLTVVNIVSIEDYLLSVVPKELGLPAIEAQKAQAVAARTYALSNLNRFARQGFDILPTVSSQVYGGRDAETQMGTRAVRETAGMVATYGGKPINALYTSTCGGRTENSEHIFDRAEPYLRGVECSLEGRRHFESFKVRSTRETVRPSTEADLELVRFSAILATNGFLMVTDRFSNEWLDAPPSDAEFKSWINQIALKFARPAPVFDRSQIKGEEFAGLIARLAYGERRADTLLSDSDVEYHLSFSDGVDVSKTRRADLAMLFRDGLLTLNADGDFHPHRPMNRRRILRLVRNIFQRKDWGPELKTGVARPSADGKLVIKSGRSDVAIEVSPSVFLFRQFGESFFQMKEVALVGGEPIAYSTGPAGEIIYLEVRPTTESTVAEKMSPFTNWTETIGVRDLQGRLSRYMRSAGNITDLRVTKVGSSRRATEIEVVGTAGTRTIKGGRIRSALGLREQLFVVDRNVDSNGKTVSFTFTGRGWGHGVGMCQYGAFGLARMGMRHDQILKHYYSGIQIVKGY
jgi:stage II sporulation protein D